ncbi:MAG: hypothetical protein COA95_01355 [Methylophaga sp.]|nr:MAG: hypothetical protein COA95_01355 [Methylophaga sp.]
MSAAIFKKHPRTVISLAIALSLSSPLSAADFTVTSGTTVTTTRSLNSAGDIGIIEVGGQIETTFGHGVSATGNTTTVDNAGNISTAGVDYVGIYAIGNNITISNSGSISTTGSAFTDGADGILSDGNNNTISNSGLISATGAGALAISGDPANSSTLNLLAGSQIIGAIDLGGAADNDTVNIYGGNPSGNLTLLNVENINFLGATGFVIGNTAMTIDPTGESSRSVALSGLTSSIHGVVSQRMAHTAPFKPVQVAALTLSPGMLFQQRAPVAWAQVFGGNANHDAEGGSLAYGTDHLGFTLGYEWDINKTRFGLLGGVVHSKTKTDMTSFKTEADSYYVGGYGHFNFGSFKLTTSLLGGYADHDNHRLVIDNLNGAEIAESTFDSFFLSPSVTLSSAYTIADR